MKNHLYVCLKMAACKVLRSNCRFVSLPFVVVATPLWWWCVLGRSKKAGDVIFDKLFCHGFTTKATGHGFGLHSSSNAAKELGGTLLASSKGIGTGATFTLSVPVVASDNSTKHLVNATTQIPEGVSV